MFSRIRMPTISTSFIQSVPGYFRMPESFFGLKFQLPRIEASILMGSKQTGKPVISMMGNRNVPSFDFKKSISYAKEAPYAR